MTLNKDSLLPSYHFLCIKSNEKIIPHRSDGRFSTFMVMECGLDYEIGIYGNVEVYYVEIYEANMH